MLQVHDRGCVANVLRGVPADVPAFAGTELYCLVTGLHAVSNLPRVVT